MGAQNEEQLFGTGKVQVYFTGKMFICTPMNGYTSTDKNYRSNDNDNINDSNETIN